MTNKQKPIVFSGVQPTGHLHLGNYLGALSQWVVMQANHRCIFSVVDYHALTVGHDPKTYHQQILDTAKTYIAAGINPKQSIIFRQSDIKEHSELAWILNCAVARMSDLNKMTQFKDKAGQNEKNVGVGLFDYPVLMAADILLYNTDLVPVGHDQVQHLELARVLAKRFNHQYGWTFKIPQVVIRQEAARIMGLDDPNKKMSKSAASTANYISLTDDVKTAQKKIMRAQTDSDNKIKYDPDKKPAIANLLTIYSLLSGQSLKALEKMYRYKGYGEFKMDLAKIVTAWLEDFQKKFNKISNQQAEKILADGAKKLQPMAQATMARVKKQLGI